MKKRTECSKEDRSKNNRKIPKINVSKPIEDKKEETKFGDDEDQNQGFSTWLRSEDGVEMMRLFVIANSLLVVVTMAWPSMQQTFSIIRDMIMAFIFRGVFLVGVLSWYSTNVWKMIDGYFRDRFQNYLHEEFKKNPRMHSDINFYAIKNAEKKGIDLSDGGTPPIPAPEEARRVEESLETGTTVDLLATAASFLESMEAKETGSGENRVKVSVDKNTFQESVEPLEMSSVRKEKPKSIGSDGFEARFAVEGEEERGKQEKEQQVIDNKGKEKSDVSHDERETRFKKIRSIIEAGKKPERSKKRKVKTITLTEADFKSTKRQDDDFSEFDLDDETLKEPSEGILVSELPFKPRADIGELETVTADEFCPLTLNDEVSCGIPSKWP